MISELALNEFKEIYKQEYGTEISDDEALALGANLLTFFNNIYRPVKKEWWDNK